MRWLVKYEPRVGDVRTVKRFALFPIRAGEEWAWMETVWIKQRRVPTAVYDWCTLVEEYWENVEFVNPEEESSNNKTSQK